MSILRKIFTGIVIAIGVIGSLIARIIGVLFLCIILLFVSCLPKTKTIKTKQGDIFNTSYSYHGFPSTVYSIDITDKETGNEVSFDSEWADEFGGMTFLCYENGNRIYLVKNFNGLLFKNSTTGALSAEDIYSLTDYYNPLGPTEEQIEKSFKKHYKVLRLLCLNNSGDIIYYFAEQFVKKKDKEITELVRYYSKAPDDVDDSYFTIKYSNDLGWKTGYHVGDDQIVERCKEIVKKYKL